MIIKINGEPLAYTLEEEKNIGEVLGSIEAACRREHETIVKVQVDGKELAPDELDRFFSRSIDTDSTIDLSTLSGTAVCGYMRELTQELLRYADDFEQIPVYMQTGKEVQALSLLEAFSMKLNELYRSLLLSDITGLPAEIRIDGKPFYEYQKEITALLQDIVSSIEEKDIIQVGDLAEYELAPLVKNLTNGVSLFLI